MTAPQTPGDGGIPLPTTVQPETIPLSGMIVRESEPLNLETPFGILDGFYTPTDHFFVRCHFRIPAIDPETWRLRIEGEVAVPFDLTYRELMSMESHTIPATLECAGNGRAFLTPQTSGAQWERGAVGNAEWTGVWLGDVLRRAGVKEAVREVIFEGADHGEILDPAGPAGVCHYARSLPLKKAQEGVLLAFKMNGEVLSASHGSPVRAIVPGWYGMASVKWLTRIIASAGRFNGFYQTIDYAFWERSRGIPTLVPITEVQVKAQIARPGFAEAVPAGRAFLVRGAAWTAGAEILSVEISTDGGEMWLSTRLRGKSVPNAWRLWDFDWLVPSAAGRAMLMVRATDSAGHTQPPTRDHDRRSYLVNHMVSIECNVQ